jgi:GT2 family glycosyltransferase
VNVHSSAKVSVRFTIAVAIVTYSDRAELLSQVLDGVFAQTEEARIGCVVVCDNGAGQSTKDFLSSVGAREPKLRVITLPENTGSAGGYAKAIKAAVDSGCEYIWCLDDDNQPAPDALEQLLLALESVKPGAALLSLREDRPQYILRANGGSVKDTFGRPHSFLGFSVLDIPKKISSRILKNFSNDTFEIHSEKPIPVPYAPYGGFFFKAKHLSQVGLPNEALYLYGDDHEFTARFVVKGYPIYLVPRSLIKDLERSWHRDRIHASRWGSQQLLSDGEESKMERLYYSVRNRAFFETHCLHWNKSLSYVTNALGYLFLLFLQAFLMALRGQRLPWRSFLVIVRGVRNGLQGRLGRARGFDK